MRLRFAVFIPAMLACSSATGVSALSGEYELESINGQLLPVPVQFGPDRQGSLLEGRLIFHENGTYEETSKFVEFVDGTVVHREVLVTGRVRRTHTPREIILTVDGTSRAVPETGGTLAANGETLTLIGNLEVPSLYKKRH